jgi:hypothetical protein
MEPFKRLEQKLNVIMDSNSLTFEKVIDKKGELEFVTLGYYRPGVVGKENTIDLSLDFGSYHNNPAWNFPIANPKKLRIQIEILEED